MSIGFICTDTTFFLIHEAVSSFAILVHKVGLPVFPREREWLQPNQLISAQGSIMEVNILDRNVGITSKQREIVERSLHYAFDQFEEHIRIVDVSFNDLNGPRGGNDIRCRLKVSLHRSGEMVVEGTGASVESVAAETSEQASHAVSKLVDRLRESHGPSMSGQ